VPSGSGPCSCGRRPRPPPRGRPADLAELNQAVALIRSNYYKDDLDYGKLAPGSVSGLVEALGDPYSYYLDPAQVRAAVASSQVPTPG